MMTAANSYLQTHSDDDHRSRVMALYMAVFFGTTPIGAPLIGALAGELGPRAALIGPGLLSVALTAGLVLAYRAAAGARAMDHADSGARTAVGISPTVSPASPAS
jgi:MFS family permease